MDETEIARLLRLMRADYYGLAAEVQKLQLDIRRLEEALERYHRYVNDPVAFKAEASGSEAVSFDEVERLLKAVSGGDDPGSRD